MVLQCCGRRYSYVLEPLITVIELNIRRSTKGLLLCTKFPNFPTSNTHFSKSYIIYSIKQWNHFSKVMFASWYCMRKNLIQILVSVLSLQNSQSAVNWGYPLPIFLHPFPGYQTAEVLKIIFTFTLRLLSFLSSTVHDFDVLSHFCLLSYLMLVHSHAPKNPKSCV